MDKRGIHWQEIATALMVIAVIFVVIFVFNSESRAEFKKLVGIREAVTGYKLPELGFLTTNEIEKAERTPEGRKALCQAEFDAAKKVYDSGDYKSASEKYKKFLDETLVKLGSDCPSGLSDIAKKGLEDASFKAVASLTNTNERVAAYTKFIVDFPGSNFLKDAYFALGALQATSFSYEEAKKNYEEARKRGYNFIDIDKALATLPKTEEEAKLVRIHLNSFRESWKYAEGYLGKDNYLASVNLRNAADYLGKDFILSSDELVNFRKFQVKLYKETGDYENAIKVYGQLDKEISDQDLLKNIKTQLKNQIGSDYYKRVELEVNKLVTLYGNTGIIVLSYDGAKAKVCPTYGGVTLDNACTFVEDTNSDEYRAVPEYPFMELRVIGIGVNEVPTILEVKLVNAIDGEKLENQFELVETNAYGADLTYRKQILPGVNIWVQYDGGGLYFTVLNSDRFSNICSSRRYVLWDYRSSNPSPNAVVCQNLPSLSIYHVSHRPPDSSGIGSTDYATVKFVYTP